VITRADIEEVADLYAKSLESVLPA
jgi:hypothetical protein